MGMYAHLTQDERSKIAVLLEEGYELWEIAQSLNRPKSTVSREISRNSRSDGKYIARYAQKTVQKRRAASKVKSRKIECNVQLQKEILEYLDPLCSPETVCHSISAPIVHGTVYAWIYRSRPDLKTLLPYHGKKRRRYGHKRAQKQGWTSKVPNIELRPAKVMKRKELYHYEGDTVCGVNGRLLTYTERASRFEIANLIDRGTCNLTHQKTVECFENIPVKTITYDRGSEFSLWQMIQRDTQAKVFFANAHHPWERGSNENANGRLRRVFPKRFDFSTISQKEVDDVVWKMNHTKRKCLSWQTPCAVFGACCTSS